MFAQRPHQRPGELSDRGAEHPGQCQALGDLAEGRLHLLRKCRAEAGRQAVTAQVLLQRLARMLVVPVAAQRDVESGHGLTDRGRDGKPDRDDDALEVGIRRARQVEPDRDDPRPAPGRFAPLRRPAFGIRQGGLQPA